MVPRMATMEYDARSAGVKVSFLIVDEELTIPVGYFGELDMTDGPPGIKFIPQTVENLRRLAFLLNSMADSITPSLETRE